MDSDNIKVIIPEGIEKQNYANTFKIGFTENEILLDFGTLIRKENVDEITAVEVISRIAISPQMLQELVLSLFKTGCEYQKQCKKDIGFNLKKEKGNPEKK